MRILLSNDDGVHAEGLNLLAEVLSEMGELDVIAPDRDRSGASNSLTLDPLRPQKLKNGYISLEGTPTDCVHLALTGFLEHKPDIVVSGINEGPNLGDDVIYSGTVAAAMEGRIFGIPSLAISLVKGEELNYKSAAIVAKQLIEQLTHDPLPAATILNVNIPDVSLDKLRGFEVTRLGTRHNAEPMIKATDPRNRTIYWVGPVGPEQDAGPGTDFHAIKSGYVSITPLQVDLTNYAAFEQVSTWVTGLAI
jgi:5'-nucleotidase